MEIRRRIGYPRSFFHVMNRGARKLSIFVDDQDRGLFRGLLGEFAKKHSVKVLGWCLMPNHYHLESDSEGTPLSLMMRDLDRTYARIFNTRHGTTGCLFQGPFKSMLIREPQGLAYVNRYIHLNPIDLGQPPGAYRWSSCSVYLGLASTPDWMDLEPVMTWLRTPGRSDAECYAFYLREGLERRKKKIRKADEVGDFYEEWIRHLEERCTEKLLGREDCLGKITPEMLVVWLAHRVYEIPSQFVADYFGYGSGAAVRNACTRMNERIQEDQRFREALEHATVLTTLKR